MDDSTLTFIQGVASGLIAAAVFEFGRHRWNPVRWRLVKLADEYWELERVSGPIAQRVVPFHFHTRPPEFDSTYEGPAAMRRMKRGSRERLFTRQLSTGFGLMWAEGSRMRTVWITIPLGESAHEVRRRETRRLKPDPIFEEIVPASATEDHVRCSECSAWWLLPREESPDSAKGNCPVCGRSAWEMPSD